MSTAIPTTRSSTPVPSVVTRRPWRASSPRPSTDSMTIGMLSHRQALSRPWRHRDRLAPVAADDHRRLGSLRHAGAGPLPCGNRRWCGRGHVGTHRPPGDSIRESTAPRHAGTADPDRAASRLAALQGTGGDRCTEHGCDRQGSRPRGGADPGLPRRLRSAADADRSRQGSRGHGEGRRSRAAFRASDSIARCAGCWS